jgi:transposase
MFRSWNSFIGPICGKQVHKRFMEYSKIELFKDFFDDLVEEYLNKNDCCSYFLTDTTPINNRYSYEINNVNPFFKNKKILKISSITDDKGKPLYISFHESIKHDSKCFSEDFNEFANNKTISKIIKKYKNRIILIADKGYDSKFIRMLLKKKKIKPIIKANRRNTKNIDRLRIFNKKEEEIYKRRLKVEHYFGKIKMYPKVNTIYEKTKRSYMNIVFLVSSTIFING